MAIHVGGGDAETAAWNAYPRDLPEPCCMIDPTLRTMGGAPACVREKRCRPVANSYLTQVMALRYSLLHPMLTLLMVYPGLLPSRSKGLLTATNTSVARTHRTAR